MQWERLQRRPEQCPRAHAPISYSPGRREFLKTLFCWASALPVRIAYGGTREHPESRAIFDESFNWMRRDLVTRIVSRAKAAGFNVLVPCVWHGTGTTWTSKVAPTVEGYQGGEPFKYFLDLANKHGLEVHAWFTVTLRQRDFLRGFYDPGTPSSKFEVHRTEFRNFVVEMVEEFVMKFPVAGINLDYVRTGGVSKSYYAEIDYAAKTGRRLLVDRALAHDTAREAITHWQAAAITDIVRRVSQAARSVRSGAVVSVDAAPWYDPYRLEGQDATAWVDEGLIDVLYSMNYERVLDSKSLNRVKRSMKRPQALVPLVANYEDQNGTVVPRDAQRIVTLIEDSRSVSSSNGVAVYLYSMLDDAQVSTLRATVFRDHVSPSWDRAN